MDGIAEHADASVELEELEELDVGQEEDQGLKRSWEWDEPK